MENIKGNLTVEEWMFRVAENLEVTMEKAVEIVMKAIVEEGVTVKEFEQLGFRMQSFIISDYVGTFV